MVATTQALKILPPLGDAERRVLTPAAQEFLTKLHRNFNKRRLQLLETRKERQDVIVDNSSLNFLPDTASVRRDPTWKVAPTPRDLQRRWVEITGPTDSKMMINALNSGADVYMADFEDANAPTWKNLVEGQSNLIDAIRGTLSYTSPEGKQYHLNEKRATITVRPHGWHLDEKHILVDDEPMSGSLFDFGLAFFHNAKSLIDNGSGPYFYLPKMQSHKEARLWNDVFIFAQNELGIPRGTIRATVLIETIYAVFEMHEILFELREHASGLNAGRWDYIFSIIKTFAHNADFLFPDRGEITMTVPFMKAYTSLLVDTCHARGAHAMGGMAAFIPNRKDPVQNAKGLEKVRDDKLRESHEGFDGTWVAHPDLVPVAREVFAEALAQQPHQKQKVREEITITPEALQNFTIPGGKITIAGLRQNIAVALQYIAAWLSGTGAVAIANLMEDAATAEISRAQLWQWIHHNGRLDDGTPITLELYKSIADKEQTTLSAALPKHHENILAARKLLDEMVAAKSIPLFFTTLAYKLLP